MDFITHWQNFMAQLEAENIHNISVGIGVFDGVHLGHAELFRSLSEYAKINNSYPIALTFAPHPRKLTSPDNPPKLLVPLNQRIELLKQHGAKKVFVIDFNEKFAAIEPEDFLNIITSSEKVKLDCITVGRNWHFGHNGVGDTILVDKFCKERNISFLPIEELKIDGNKISSANIRIAIADGFLDKASAMLGYKYFIHGEVIKGFSFAGNRLGHPTANLHTDSEILPPDGVYAAKTVIDGHTYPAAVNIGVSPSFDFNQKQHRIEVHVLDFDGNLYGRELKVTLIKHLRNERVFESAEALKAQIILDIQQIRSLT